MNTLRKMVNMSILYFIMIVYSAQVEQNVDEQQVVNDEIVDHQLETAPENQLIALTESKSPEQSINDNEAIDSSRKVEEPICKDTTNFFNLLESFVAFTLEYFAQNHQYFQYLDEDKIREAVIKFSDLKKNVLSLILNLFCHDKEKNITQEDKNDKEKNITQEDKNDKEKNITQEDKNDKDKNIAQENKSQDKEDKTMPTGNHKLSEKCFKDRFLECKETNHAQEIFDLIINDDKNIINFLSIDDEILKSVITYKKMLTIDENNKIVDFLNILLKNKPNDQTKRLIENNTNGYHLIYPKNNASNSLIIRLLSNLKDKILEDNNINKPVPEK